MDRREYLNATTGLAAAAAAVPNATAAQDPIAQVADRTSTLRITGLQTFWSGPSVYLRLNTNHNVVGWGEVKAVHPRARTTACPPIATLATKVMTRPILTDTQCGLRRHSPMALRAAHASGGSKRHQTPQSDHRSAPRHPP